VAELSRDEVWRRDANHCEVRVRIVANQLCLKLTTIHERDVDLRCTVYHVAVCENETIGCEDETRTAARYFIRPAPTAICCDLNVNNRGTYPFRGFNNRTRIGVEQSFCIINLACNCVLHFVSPDLIVWGN